METWRGWDVCRISVLWTLGWIHIFQQIKIDFCTIFSDSPLSHFYQHSLWCYFPGWSLISLLFLWYLNLRHKGVFSKEEVLTDLGLDRTVQVCMECALPSHGWWGGWKQPPLDLIAPSLVPGLIRKEDRQIIKVSPVPVIPQAQPRPEIRDWEPGLQIMGHCLAGRRKCQFCVLSTVWC